MITSSTEQPPPEHRVTMRLHRNATDRVCFGVCSGLAEYLAIDSSVVRLVFAIATLWGGAGLLVYVILAVVLPVDEAASGAPTRMTAERRQLLAGGLLIVLGGLLLASNLGFAPWLTWNLFWPTLLILIGLALLVRQPHRTAA